MSDMVNDFGLGAPDTQHSAPVEHGWRPDPLAHGLGAGNIAAHEHDGEDFAEGGRTNRLEHGLVMAGESAGAASPTGKQNPLAHGLGPTVTRN